MARFNLKWASKTANDNLYKTPPHFPLSSTSSFLKSSHLLNCALTKTDDKRAPDALRNITGLCYSHTTKTKIIVAVCKQLAVLFLSDTCFEDGDQVCTRSQPAAIFRVKFSKSKLWGQVPSYMQSVIKQHLTLISVTLYTNRNPH